MGGVGAQFSKSRAAKGGVADGLRHEGKNVGQRDDKGRKQIEYLLDRGEDQGIDVKGNTAVGRIQKLLHGGREFALPERGNGLLAHGLQRLHHIRPDNGAVGAVPQKGECENEAEQ